MSGNQRGIEELRAAIERVAADIEVRPVPGPRRTSWLPGLALGAAALIVLLIGSWWIVRPRTSEVEVLELRVAGRAVRARIVEDPATATIIVMPQPERSTPPAAITGVIGGAR